MRTNKCFIYNTAGAYYAFMACDPDGEIMVRSNICPACRSTGFSLRGDELVCDICGTLFDAADADVIIEASYAFHGGNIVMTGQDMLNAYQATLNPGGT